MPINIDKHPFVFSTTTRLAYNIDNEYYDRKHYVWVALKFNDIDNQADSSNPLTIATSLARSVATLDRHSAVILGNIAGVRNGVKQMKSLLKINNKAERSIISEIKLARFEDFLPLLYVIDTRKVIGRIVEVPPADTARESSPEYKIYDLQEGEFELIDLSEIVLAGKKIEHRRVK